MKIDDFCPIQTTPYSLQIKLKIYAWKLVNKTIFRIIPNQIRKPRIIMLRLFGSDIADTVFIHRNSNIEHPWNLTIGHLSSIGDNSWIYCLDKINIGQKCTIGKDCYLITGSHSITDVNFKLKTKPIQIKDGSWLTTGVYIMPGITIGEFSVISARSVVTKDTEEFDVVSGFPAEFIKKRNFDK